MSEKTLINQVDRNRIQNLLMDFIKIPSPTFKERNFAEHLSKYLKKIGFKVEVDYEFPDSPSVICWLDGGKSRPVLQFDGHIDHVAFPHSPPYIKEGKIYGRGAADMKAGLVAIIEALRIIKESNYISNKGKILFTAHGLHEPPGDSNSLKALIRKGIYGDACVVAEGGRNYLTTSSGKEEQFFLATKGKGLIFFEFYIKRKGKEIHELFSKSSIRSNPLLIGYHLIDMLVKKGKIIEKNRMKDIGAGSLFLYRFKAGDKTQRFPRSCIIEGSRRYLPGETLEDINKEFNTLHNKIQDFASPEIEVKLKVIDRRQPFEIDKDSLIVYSLKKAYLSITGKNLVEGIMSSVADGSYFTNLAHIPFVYQGVNTNNSAHSSLEFVDIDDVARTAKIYLQIIIEYFSNYKNL